MRHYVLDARTATPHFPGIGRYVANLARALVPCLAADERLTVLHAPDYPLALPSHPAVHLEPVTTSPFALAQQWQLPRLLRQLSADLYHSAYYLMPYRPGVPTLLTLYDLIPILFPQHSTRQARTFFRWATWLALRAARHSVVISEASRRDFIANFRLPEAHITATPLAADPIFDRQSADTITALRARLALPAHFVLYLGSNKPHKNLVRLIAAYAQLPHADTPPLVIAGAWLPEHPEARQRAVDLGLNDAQVRWLGPVPNADLPALYAAATVFVFPSLYEGFGLPVIEAMACGTPVACARTSSLPEVADEAALLFDPHATADIARALSALLGDKRLRERLRSAGMQQAQKFSWERTAQETIAVYHQILSNDPTKGE